MAAMAGNTVPGALCGLFLLSARGPLPSSRQDMDRHRHPKFQRDQPLDTIYLRSLLVHYNHDHRRLRRPPRRQHHGDDLHHLLHALQPRTYRIPYREHDQSRRRRHSPHHGVRKSLSILCQINSMMKQFIPTDSLCGRETVSRQHPTLCAAIAFLLD